MTQDELLEEDELARRVYKQSVIHLCDVSLNTLVHDTAFMHPTLATLANPKGNSNFIALFLYHLTLIHQLRRHFMTSINQNLRPLRSFTSAVLGLFLWLTLFLPLHNAFGKESEMSDLLEMSLEELLQVKVTTATRTEEKVTEVPASVVIITRRKIEKYGYRTLTEILENVPGLYGINQYYREGTAFGIRGFWSGWTNKQIVVLVDGVRQVYPMRSNYPLTTIAVPVEVIERIEIIRGPMSVIYGDGAFFGAINIITDSSHVKKATSLVSAAGGSLETNKVVAKLTGQSNDDDFHYTLNASRYQTKGIDAPYSKMVLPNFLNGIGVPEETTTANQLGSTETYVSFLGKYKDLSTIVSYVDGSQDSLFQLPSLVKGAQNATKVTTLTVNYDHDWSNRLAMQAHFTYLSYQHFSDTGGVTSWAGPIATEDNHANYYEVELNTVYTPSPRLKVLTGLSYHAFPRLSRPTNIPKLGINNLTATLEDDIINVGLFSQANYKWTDQLEVVAGIRLESLNNYNIFQSIGQGSDLYELHRHYGKGSIEAVPRLALLYHRNEQQNFKFLYGEAINWPAFEQNTVNGSNLKIYPTDSLEPERIRTFELVHTFTPSTIWGLQVSLFHNSLEKLIIRDSKLIQGKFLSIQNNSGALTTNGIETMLQWHPTSDWEIEVSGSYQHTKDRKFSTDAAYSPSWLGYLKASYRWQPDMILAITGNYVDKMESLISPQTGQRIGDEVDGYFMLGANFRVENLFAKGTFFNLRVTNLLDEEVRYPAFTNNPWAKKGTIGEGRAFLMSAGFKF